MLGRLFTSVPRVAACCSAQASSSSVPLSRVAPRRSLHSSPSSSALFGNKDDTPQEVSPAVEAEAPAVLDPENMPSEYRTEWEREQAKKDGATIKAAPHEGLKFAPPADIHRPTNLHEYIDPTTGQLYPASLLPRTPKPTADDKWDATHKRQYKDELTVRDDHPLWAFFHKDKKTGKPVAIEAVQKEDTDLLRPWKASELRLKSFQDLHTLWFLLLREKNIYYSQEIERRRRGLSKRDKMGTQSYRKMIQLSMARIKLVASERNQIYKAAALEAAREKAEEEEDQEAERRLIAAGAEELDEMDLEGDNAREQADEEAEGGAVAEEDWVEEGKQQPTAKA